MPPRRISPVAAGFQREGTIDSDPPPPGGEESSPLIRVLILVAGLLVGGVLHPSQARALEVVPDSIQDQLNAGRFWKASVALRAHLAPLAEASLEDRLILAGAEAGWKNWPGVIEVLELGAPQAGESPGAYWYLLGMAKEQLGDLGSGREALQRFLTTEPPGSATALVARSRLLRNPAVPPAASEGFSQVVDGLVALRQASPVLADWTALELAERFSEEGRPEETGRILDLVVGAASGRAGWSWVADAWARAGDTAQALQALEALDPDAPIAPAPAALLEKVLPLRLAAGDTARALEEAVALIGLATRGAGPLSAARLIIEKGSGLDGPGLARVALALGRGGEHDLALRAWDLAEGAGAVLSDPQRLSRAGSLLSAGSRASARAEYQALAESLDGNVAVPAIRALIGLNRGQRAQARALEDELIRRFPEREEALQIAFLRGDDLQDAGRLDEAIAAYERVVAMSGAANLAGLARMRWGHIHLTRGAYAEAASVFEGYLEEFPNGRRWDEASYWGAWAAVQHGQPERGARLAARLLEGGPLTYYAVLAEGLDLGTPSTGLEEGRPLPQPAWVGAELSLLEMLQGAGLERGANAHVAAMKEAAWDSDDVLMRLAQELNARGRTMDGINLGWELRRRGRTWDKTLLRVVYPFPYRDMVMSFAAERGLDPYLLAGLIRQESAFVPDIVSRAGAVGLMQVIPATGQELARAVGPRGFRSDALTTPEVNMHLGTRFLADLLRRYPDLPLVLSAYNAGPTRADRWRKFPEASDPARFTERIPFAETRGYVKNVTRNRALYRYLYSEDGPAATDR